VAAVPEKLLEPPVPVPAPDWKFVAPPAPVASVDAPCTTEDAEPAAFCAPPAPTVTVMDVKAENVIDPVA
jgi:hypothetical protein